MDCSTTTHEGMRVTNPFETIPVAERMRVRRQHLQLSREEASARARRYLPDFLPMSREILRKLETGDHSPDDHPLQVIALARALDVAPSWFGVNGGEGFERLGELIRTASVVVLHRESAESDSSDLRRGTPAWATGSAGRDGPGDADPPGGPSREAQSRCTDGCAGQRPFSFPRQLGTGGNGRCRSVRRRSRRLKL